MDTRPPHGIIELDDGQEPPEHYTRITHQERELLDAMTPAQRAAWLVARQLEPARRADHADEARRQAALQPLTPNRAERRRQAALQRRRAKRRPPASR